MLLITLLNFLVFLLLTFLFLYVVGYLVISRVRKNLESWELISLSTNIGIIVFVFLAISLALLNLRILSLPILVILCLYSILSFKGALIDPWSVLLKDKILTAILLIGIVSLSLINIPSGYLYEEGLLFWSSQGHDGLWHITAMEGVRRNIPPPNLAYSGEIIANYHYLVDVLMGEFGRIFTSFSLLDLYFRYFPALFSLMIGLSVFSLATRWKEDKRIGYLALVITFFGGSFGYIVSFIQNGNFFSGETVFWAAQQHTIIGNPPHALSHSLLASFFLAYLLYQRLNKKFFLFFAFLVGFVLTGFKVSGGIVMLAGLAVAAGVELMASRNILIPGLFLALLITNLLTFKSVTLKGAESNLMFLPWWFIRTLIVDKLGWIDLEHRRQHYLSKGTWTAYLRILQLELFGLLLFIVGNSGMRVLGFWPLIKRWLSKSFYKDSFEVMLFVSMMTGLIVPIFFVQRGIIYNNIQFMQYFLFILGLYTAVSIHQICNAFRNRFLRYLVFAVIFLLMVPTAIGSLMDFYGPGRKPLAIVSNQELEALNYLKRISDPKDVILSKPYDSSLKYKFISEPRPIYAWYDTSYLSALSGRAEYLASEHVTLLGYPDSEIRAQNRRKFFQQQDLDWGRDFLTKNNISHIYLTKGQADWELDLEQNGLEVVFENSEVIIYKVKR